MTFTTCHLLKSTPGKCVACGAVYGDVVTGKTSGQVGVDSQGRPIEGDVDKVERFHPGSYFDDPAPWSLHHDRCDKTRTASGTIDDIKWSDVAPLPRAPGV